MIIVLIIIQEVINVYYGNKLVATIKDHNGGQGWGTITYDQGLYHSSNVAICNLLDQGYVTKMF